MSHVSDSSGNLGCLGTAWLEWHGRNRRGRKVGGSCSSERRSLKDITELQKVRFVMKGGVIFKKKLRK